MKKKNRSKRQIQELEILTTSMFYLTIFLEKAGVIKDGRFVDNVKEFEEKDITGAISLGKQMMFILSRVKMSYQEKAMQEAQKAFNKCKNEIDFNYLVFVLILLMEYKENFKNKVYHIPTSYDELNDIFDEYFALGLKDKEQMEIIKDSSNVAEEFYGMVINEEDKDSKQGNR